MLKASLLTKGSAVDELGVTASTDMCVRSSHRLTKSPTHPRHETQTKGIQWHRHIDFGSMSVNTTLHTFVTCTPVRVLGSHLPSGIPSGRPIMSHTLPLLDGQVPLVSFRSILAVLHKPLEISVGLWQLVIKIRPAT